jgi:hypothetical protein
VRPEWGSSSTQPAAAEMAETSTTSDHMATTRRRGQPAALSPLEDDMPSGRLDRATPASRGTLTPPWSTVRPSTNDSGMPSRTDPSTIAMAEPSACSPVGSLRSPPPRRLRIQLPTVKVAAPTRTSRATQATAWCSRASSTSSKETEPISRPVPTAITTAITCRLGFSR